MHALNLRKQLADFFYQRGYTWLEVDLVEHADLFLTRASAQIAENLYMFEKDGVTFALRPEFTAAAMSHYVRGAYQTPIRWQFSGYIFQEKHGKPQQMLSAGIELLGDAALQADVEVIALAAQALAHLGKSESTLYLGHVGLHRHILRQFGLDAFVARMLTHASQQLTLEMLVQSSPISTLNTTEQTSHILNVLLDSTRYGATMGGRSRHDIVNGILARSAQHIDEAAAQTLKGYLDTWTAFKGDAHSLPTLTALLPFSDETTQAFCNRWQATIDALLAQGIAAEHITLQPNLAHSWDYYTGCVFAFVDDNGTVLANGGRYDELGYIVGGIEVPATGFALHLEHFLPRPTTSSHQKEA